MRTTTSDQDRVLSNSHRRVSVRVFIDRGAGDWVNLSDLEGRDWVSSVQWGDSQDASVVTAQIRLHQKIELMTLAPLVDGSKLNDSGTLIDLGNPIYVEVAVTPQDDQPSAADWVEVFRGEVDSIDWAASPMTIRCRDNSGKLADRFIEVQRRIPSDLAVAPVEAVMQEILDNEFGTGPDRVVLYSINGTLATPFVASDSPEWYVPAYIQKKQPVLQALRALADQIGWYVRQAWNDSVGGFVLTLYEPPRAKAARGTLWLDGVTFVGETFTLNGTAHTAVVGPTPAINEWVPSGSAIDNAPLIVDMLVNNSSQSANIAGAWIVPPRSAVGSLTFTGNPSIGQTMVINATTMTCVSALTGNNQFLLGASALDTATNLADAINTTSDEQSNVVASVVVDGAGTPHVRLEWSSKGSAGNAVVFTESLTGVTADGGGTLGGTTRGFDAAVQVEWGTKGTVGNAVTWTEAMANATMDGGGTLGGTRLGADVAGSIYTFGPNRYYAPKRVSLDRSGIRNVIRVKYGVSDLDRTTVEVSDSGSIAKYGRRFMEVAEAGSSQINTEAEGRYMAAAILDDLSEPDVNLSIQVPFFWPVELVGDVYTFAADDYHFDSDQELAVVSYKHNLTPKLSRSDLMLRGKPSGGFKRWLELDARAGIASQNPFYQHSSAEGLSTTPGIGLIVVQYDDPRGMSPPINDWAFTRVHLSETPGFTADESNQVAVGRTTRFEIGGLTPGTTYYIKLAIIDSAGVVAALTNQISQATELVGPYHQNTDREYGMLTPNREFGAQTKDVTTNEPDFWEAFIGTWGPSAQIYVNTSETQTGGQSIEFRPVAANTQLQFRSGYFPVTAGDFYNVRADMKLGGTPTLGTLSVGLRFFDTNKSTVSTNTIIGPLAASAISSSSFDRRTGANGATAPSNARFARVLFFHDDQGDTYSLYLDRCECFRDFPGFSARKSGGSQTIPASTWTTYQANLEYFDKGGNYDTTTYQFTAPQTGFYNFRLAGLFSGLSVGTQFNAALLINGSTRIEGDVLNKSTITNDTFDQSFDSTQLTAGDTVEMQVIHNSGGTVNLSLSSTFNGRQVA